MKPEFEGECWFPMNPSLAERVWLRHDPKMRQLEAVSQLCSLLQFLGTWLQNGLLPYDTSKSVSYNSRLIQPQRVETGCRRVIWLLSGHVECIWVDGESYL